MQAALIILEIYGIEYFKTVFLNIYNCVYKTPFTNPVTNLCYTIKDVYNVMLYGENFEEIMTEVFQNSDYYPP